MIVTEFLATLGLDVNSQSFAKGAASFELIGRAANLMLDTVIRLTRAIPDMISQVVNTGDMLDETSQMTGVATSALQELGYAGKFSGLSVQDLAQGMKFLSKAMVSASEGGKEASKALDGIAFKNADGSLKSVDGVLGQIADRFASMSDGAAKSQLAVELFGRAGVRMIPFLNAGAAGIEKLREEARELGVVLNEETIQQAVKLADTQDKLSASWQGVKNQIGGELLPVVLELTEGWLKWWKANKELVKVQIQKWIDRVRVAIEIASHVVKTLWTVFRGLLDYLQTDSGRILGMLVGALALVRSATLKAALPWLAWAAAITAVFLIIEDFVGWIQGKDSAFGDLAGGSFKEFWDELFSDAKDGDPWWVVAIKVFAQILADLPGAMDAAIDWWKVQFQRFFDWLDMKWQTLKSSLNEVANFFTGDTSGGFLNDLSRASGNEVRAPGVVSLAPSLAGVPAGGQQVITAKVGDINVYGTPGMDVNDLTSQVQKQVAEKMSVILAHTYTQVNRGR